MLVQKQHLFFILRHNDFWMTACTVIGILHLVTLTSINKTLIYFFAIVCLSALWCSWIVDYGSCTINLSSPTFFLQITFRQSFKSKSQNVYSRTAMWELVIQLIVKYVIIIWIWTSIIVFIYRTICIWR